MGQLTDISVRSKREMFGAIHIQSIYLTSALQMAEIGREKPHEVDDFWRKSLNIKQIYFSAGIFTHWWFRMLKIQRPCCASILLHSLASIDSLLLGCIVEAFARRFNDTEEWRKKYNCSLAFVVFCLSIFFCWCVCVLKIYSRFWMSCEPDINSFMKSLFFVVNSVRILSSANGILDWQCLNFMEPIYFLLYIYIRIVLFLCCRRAHKFLKYYYVLLLFNCCTFVVILCGDSQHSSNVFIATIVIVRYKMRSNTRNDYKQQKCKLLNNCHNKAEIQNTQAHSKSKWKTFLFFSLSRENER